MSYRYNNLYIMHYGVARRSGRYPWGSGDRPYQGDTVKLDSLKDMPKLGSGNTDDTLSIPRRPWNTFKDAGGDFINDPFMPLGDEVKYTGDPIRFTSQFNSKPIDDYKQSSSDSDDVKTINDKPTNDVGNQKTSNTTVKLNDIKKVLSEMDAKSDRKELSDAEKAKMEKDRAATEAIREKKKEGLTKNIKGDVVGIAGDINSMSKEIRLYQQGKLSDKAKKKLDRKIRKMSDDQLSELARRMSLESNAIEQSNRRKRLTAATGKSRTEHLMDLGLSGLNTTVSVIDLISSIRKLSAL